MSETHSKSMAEGIGVVTILGGVLVVPLQYTHYRPPPLENTLLFAAAVCVLGGIVSSSGYLMRRFIEHE